MGFKRVREKSGKNVEIYGADPWNGKLVSITEMAKELRKLPNLEDGGR